MKWIKWKDQEPVKGNVFLLEWDGSFVKAFYWRGVIEIQWLGETYILKPDEIQSRYWLSIPRIPTD